MIGFLIGILQFYKDRNFPTSIRSICGTYIAAFALVMRLMPHILPQFDHQYLIIRIIMNMYWTVVCPCNPTTYIKTVGVPHKWLIASPYGSDGGSGTSRSFSSRSGIMIGWKQNSNVDRTEGSVIGLWISPYVWSRHTRSGKPYNAVGREAIEGLHFLASLPRAGAGRKKTQPFNWIHSRLFT